MRQCCTGPLVYTIKSCVLFVSLLVFAAAGRNGACGVSTESPRRGGVRKADLGVVRAPGAEIQNFEVLTGREMAGKWRK